jgi:hypothetical protein
MEQQYNDAPKTVDDFLIQLDNSSRYPPSATSDMLDAALYYLQEDSDSMVDEREQNSDWEQEDDTNDLMSDLRAPASIPWTTTRRHWGVHGESALNKARCLDGLPTDKFVFLMSKAAFKVCSSPSTTWSFLVVVSNVTARSTAPLCYQPIHGVTPGIIGKPQLLQS